MNGCFSIAKLEEEGIVLYRFPTEKKRDEYFDDIMKEIEGLDDQFDYAKCIWRNGDLTITYCFEGSGLCMCQRSEGKGIIKTITVDYNKK
uniref:Uncharacterized protein n=1 Tax=viral metagenome TaxID=1070528 RepID=A0A6C0JUI0_9ZZZZ